MFEILKRLLAQFKTLRLVPVNFLQEVETLLATYHASTKSGLLVFTRAFIAGDIAEPDAVGGELAVGARVRRVKKSPSYPAGGAIGAMGTVVSLVGSDPGIEWDDAIAGGHSLGGRVSSGRGYYVPACDVEVIGVRSAPDWRAILDEIPHDAIGDFAYEHDLVDTSCECEDADEARREGYDEGDSEGYERGHREGYREKEREVEEGFYFDTRYEVRDFARDDLDMETKVNIIEALREYFARGLDAVSDDGMRDAIADALPDAETVSKTVTASIPATIVPTEATASDAGAPRADVTSPGAMVRVAREAPVGVYYNPDTVLGTEGRVVCFYKADDHAYGTDKPGHGLLLLEVKGGKEINDYHHYKRVIGFYAYADQLELAGDAVSSARTIKGVS